MHIGGGGGGGGSGGVFLAYEDLEEDFRFFFFFKVEISSRTQFHSLSQDQSTVAQRAKTTADERFLTSCV